MMLHASSRVAPGIRRRTLCLLGAAIAASTGALAGNGDGLSQAIDPALRASTAEKVVRTSAKGAGFAESRRAIAAGGGRSAGAPFAIRGTIGQPDADPLQPSMGGVYAITGGFQPGIAPAMPVGDPIFGNNFESGLRRQLQCCVPARERLRRKRPRPACPGSWPRT